MLHFHYYLEHPQSFQSHVIYSLDGPAKFPTLNVDDYKAKGLS